VHTASYDAASVIRQALANGDYLRKMRGELERHRGVEYIGKGSPSSGFISVFFYLQMCNKLDVYGIATDSDTRSGKAQYTLTVCSSCT
jgi:hypothetical protein